MLLPIVVKAQAVLTYAELLSEALENNRLGIIAQHDKQEASHIAQQISLLSNPELELGTENLGIGEVELIVSQAIPLGGRRSSMVSLQQLEVEKADLKMQQQKLIIIAAVQRSYFQVVGVQSRIAIMDSVIGIARDELERIKRRVFIGAGMALDTLRAQTELIMLELEAKALVTELEGAQIDVSIALGRDSKKQILITGSFPATYPDVNSNEVLLVSQKHPDHLLSELECEGARLETIVAQAETFSELSLSGGIKRNNEDGAMSGMLSASIQIPLFNRNQGEIAASRIRETRGRVEQQQLIHERNATIQHLVNEISLLKEKIEVVSQKVVPNYLKTYQKLNSFYMQGKMGIRELFESRNEYLEQQFSLVALQLEWTTLAADLLEISGTTLYIQGPEGEENE
ncbi:MAG: TolC family protein [Fibrobacterales bacterium]